MSQPVHRYSREAASSRSRAPANIGRAIFVANAAVPAVAPIIMADAYSAIISISPSLIFVSPPENVSEYGKSLKQVFS